jgi:hypothetical protein
MESDELCKWGEDAFILPYNSPVWSDLLLGFPVIQGKK